MGGRDSDPIMGCRGVEVTFTIMSMELPVGDVIIQYELILGANMSRVVVRRSEGERRVRLRRAKRFHFVGSRGVRATFSP